tara:strand:- start:368 stop:934 length:567 start_codon:yes stop_codon:yes gene_type:complete
MRKLFLSVIAVFVVSMAFTSCAALEAVFGDSTVVTTPDQVREGAKVATIPFDQLPESVREKFPNQKDLVVADTADLKEDAKYVQLGGSLTDGGFEGLLSTGFEIGKAFLPGLAAWEGALAFLSRRKRKHWVKVAKAAVPHKGDSTINLGGALKSMGAALGISHSSAASQDVVEKEDAAEIKKAAKKKA